MEDAAAILSLAAAVAGWWSLARSMKLNGRPWWWRHLAGATAGLSTLFAAMFLLEGLGFQVSPDASLSGVASFLYATVMLAPLVVSLVMSRKSRTGRKSKEAASPATIEEIQTENRQAARQALSSRQWKRQAHKARAKADRDKLPTTTITEPRSAASGNRLRFVYEDVQGNMTQRELSSWHDDGIYLEGHCLTAGAHRTFRRDRIIEFLEGAHLLDPADSRIDDTTTQGNAPALEILFTGFPAGERAKLEAQAAAAGMVVRKTVTWSLMFVCAGPRAGATKLSQARNQGCTILREEEFQDMLATGELPCV